MAGTRLLPGPAPLIGLAAILVLLAPAAAGGDDREFPAPSRAERMEFIRRARVWEPTDVSSKDLYNGPSGTLNYAVDQEVPCDFVPKPLSGWTEKFLCRLEDGTIVKVKYLDGDHYKEVFGEVLGTRLFWALGFYCDRMLPVRVTCRGCPRRPWRYVNARSKPRLDPQGFIASLPPEAEIGTYTFDPAAMEERVDGKIIEERDNQGWSWRSLDQVDPRVGGATRAEIDALKLLNAFVQNADNSAEQNTLRCPRDRLGRDGSGRITCLGPVMYVDDLGAVFGRGGFTTGYAGRVDLEGWRERPVWQDKERCKARLTSIGGIFRRSTLRNPVISEGGRALLAKQLGQLSDAQITDLFRAARIERLHQTVPDGTSGRREVTLKDWVDLFKIKRDEITKHPGCPAAS